MMGFASPSRKFVLDDMVPTSASWSCRIWLRPSCIHTPLHLDNVRVDAAKELFLRLLCQPKGYFLGFFIPMSLGHCLDFLRLSSVVPMLVQTIACLGRALRLFSRSGFAAICSPNIAGTVMKKPSRKHFGFLARLNVSWFETIIMFGRLIRIFVLRPFRHQMGIGAAS